MSNSRYCIVLTHNRHELLKQCLDAIQAQVDQVLVIDNASDPPVRPDGVRGSVMYVPDQPPNLSDLWNRGFRWIEWSPGRAEQWDIAMLCDDVIVPDGWFQAVSSCMREHGAVAGSTHSWRPVNTPIVKTHPHNDIHNRLQGSAFVLNGEVGLRADESLHWWWCDTDLDWQARLKGGMVIAPGLVAHNIHPNDFTNSVPGLAEQAGKDGNTFKAKWSWRPW
jgi:GT2 family glycosyltransferase